MISIDEVLHEELQQQCREASLKPHRYGSDYRILECLLHNNSDEELKGRVHKRLFNMCMKAREEGTMAVLHTYYEEKQRVADNLVPFGQYKGQPYATLHEDALRSMYGFLMRRYAGDEEKKAAYLEQVTFELNRRRVSS